MSYFCFFTVRVGLHLGKPRLLCKTMTEANSISPAASDPGHAPGKAQSAFIIALIVLASVLAYHPVLRFDFITYDDPDYVTENAHVQSGLTTTNIVWALKSGHAANWHPLTWISHMVDVRLFGLNPAGHHATNVLLHVIDSVLLFALFRRLTGAAWRSGFVALLFAVHPAHVESVAWISERKDVLSTLFFFLTLLAYTAYSKRKDAPPPGPRRVGALYALSLVLFALGLMSKPMLVTLPCVLLLLDFWPLARFRSRGWPSLVVEKIPFFALSFGSCVITLLVQKEAEQGLDTYPLRARIANMLVSYLRYLGKLMWPFNLATPYPGISHWPASYAVGAALILVLGTIAFVWSMRKFPFGIVGWLWFLGTLIPVIGIVQVGEQSMADRYTYVPFVGLFIVLVWGAGEVAARLRIPRSIDVLLGLLACALCTWRSHDQVQTWRDSATLYRHAINVTRNNFIAYYNLGNYADHHGRADEAMTNYLKSVEIQPHYPEPLNNIGCLFTDRKQFAEAIPYFEAAIKSRPDFTDAHENLANALRELGRLPEALPHYRVVVEKRPAESGSLNGLGNALAQQAKYTEAIPYYEASLKVKPDQAAAHYSLANALMKLRRLDESISHYRSSLEFDPGNALALHDLGIALAMRGSLDEGAVVLRKAVSLQPTNAVYLLTLGKVLAQQGKPDQALVYFNDAVRLAPGNPDARNSLGSALATTGQLDQAIEQFHESIRLRPLSPSTHFNLGRALAAQGKSDEARTAFAEVLRLKPDLVAAQRELQRLDSLKPGSNGQLSNPVAPANP
jgi:tetratricopeptide (TPR) repeat protein